MLVIANVEFLYLNTEGKRNEIKSVYYNWNYSYFFLDKQEK